MGEHRTTDPADEFDAIIAGRQINPVFQPIISLGDRLPVGFEALARGWIGALCRV